MTIAIYKNIAYYTLFIFIVLILYFTFVGIIYGSISVLYPEYNMTSGCLNNQTNCSQHLLCYDNNLTLCFLSGFVISISCLFIIIAIYNSLKYINNNSKRDYQTIE